MLFRPGNVHDSNGAVEFILENTARLKHLPLAPLGTASRKQNQSAQFDYIPFRRQAANQLFMCTSALAHNLTRELQMIAEPRCRRLTEKRAAGWLFKKLATLRNEVLLRAGRLANPISVALCRMVSDLSFLQPPTDCAISATTASAQFIGDIFKGPTGDHLCETIGSHYETRVAKPPSF